MSSHTKPIPLLLLEKPEEEDTNNSLKRVKFYKENLDSVLTQVGNLPVSLISVAGPTLPASSFLLCYIINHLQAEEDGSSQSPPITWGAEDNPPQDKTGTWILNRPICIRNSAILLLYSQSSEEDFLAEDSIMNALVGLDLRLSSLTIITSMDKLSLEFLSKVATFIKYGKEGEATPQNLLEELAFFVPNWTLVSRFPLGEEGGQTLLQRMLSISPPEVEEDFYKYFQAIHSYLAPKSGESLNNPEPDFISSLKSFVGRLMSSETLERRALGKGLFATGLKNMIEAHMKKINLYIDLQQDSNPQATPGNDSQSQPSQFPPNSNSPISSKLPFFQRLNSSLANKNSFPEETFSQNPPPPPTSSPPPISPPPSHLTKRPTAPPPPQPQPRKLSTKAPKSAPPPPPPQSQKPVERNPAPPQENRGSISGLVKEGTKKYVAFMSSLHRKSGCDYLTESALDKSHKEAVKKTIQSLLGMLDAAEDDDGKIYFEKKLRNQLERELSILKQQHEEERQLFLEDLINDLVSQYKMGYNSKGEQKSKEMMKSLLDDLKDTLENNHDEDLWPLQQLESRLKKIEGKFKAVQETEMVESSELIEMGLDLAVNDYKREMEKFLGGNFSLQQKSLEEMHQECKEKCLDSLEEQLGADWDDTVEKKLESKLAMVYQEFEEKFRPKAKVDLTSDIKECAEEVQRYYEKELRKLMEKGPVNETLLEEKNEQVIIHICTQFRSHLEGMGIDKDAVNSYEKEMRKELGAIFTPLKKENGQALELYVSKLKNLTLNCLQEYQSIMSGELNNVGSSEELKSLHEAAYHRAMLVMQTVHLAQTDPTFVQTHMMELKTEIESAFEEIWELYNLKEGKEALTVKGEVRRCVELYEDEMDKHLRANEFIRKEELERLHNRVKERILQRNSCKLTGDQEEELIQLMEELFIKCAEQNVMENQNEPAIGIDLGTTYCCTAIYAKGRVHVIRNGIGKNTTPSYVAFKDGKKEIVGEPAKSQAYSNPENTIFDAKRIIGRKFGDKKLQEDMTLWPFTVVDEMGIPKIRVGEKSLHPEEISAKLLRQLKRDAEAYLEEEVRKAVITVPAYFTDGQRQATVDAGKMAGLQVLFILAEPTAAALAYKLQHSFQGRERNVLIFDLGGGTFDVAVMKTSKGKIDILAVDGDTHLGGQDFDRSLMIYCAEEFKNEHKIDLFEGKDEENKQKRDGVRRKLQRLQAECEKRKIELASARAAEVCVDNMHGDIDLNVLVTRETFERLNAPLFQTTIDIVGRALKSAGLQKGVIDDVVLVGGSTRIPIVQEMLKNYFGGKKLDCSINPDEAVAFGAAMKAAMLNGGGEEGSIELEEIQDVTAMSIGVQVYGGGFSVIIPKGTKMPVKANECYQTAHDDQTSVQISIFQGEEKVAMNNEKLGDFCLVGIPPKKAGVENVDVEMVINSQGILNVAAVSTSTGLREVSVIENKQRLGKDAIQAYLQLEGDRRTV
ncbi:unnamed protein product [Orchesella dallaii]|uniref:Uncharacterized protein n=1 Tax=Orchesella dallaii TaxID=48710 RepID=A0ABP1RUU5_9HEXA